jgi:putative intracellular protease/amidase
MKIVKRQKATGKYIAAICATPSIALFPHGVLDHVKATCHPSVKDILIKNNKFEDKKIVHEKNISKLNISINFISHFLRTRDSNGLFTVLS